MADWCRQVAEDTGAVEGASAAWIEAAARALGTGFPEVIGTPEADVVAGALALTVAELGPDGDTALTLALCRAVWSDLRVVDGAVRVGITPYLPGIVGETVLPPAKTPATPAFGGTLRAPIFTPTPGPGKGGPQPKEQRTASDVGFDVNALTAAFGGMIGGMNALTAAITEKHAPVAAGADRDLATDLAARLSRASRSSPGGGGTGTSGRAEVAELQRGLKKLARNPAEVLAIVLTTYAEDADWPFGGYFSGRVAAVQLTKMLRGGTRAREYWRAYVKGKELQGNKTAEAGEAFAIIIDQLIFEDGVNLQSRALEAACRELYGRERVFEHVTCKKDWDGGGKADYDAYELYSFTAAGDIEAVDAEEAVKKELQRRAERSKWLLKAARSQ